MLESRAICETCGHTRDWHDREGVRSRLRQEPPIERTCYREIGETPCPCTAFADSGTVVVPAGSRSMRGTTPGFAVVRVAAIALLVVVAGLGLLYAYRSQTPSLPEVDLPHALQDINAGRIRAVSISADEAILEFRDSPSHKEQTALPEGDTLLATAVSNYSAAHPSEPIELRFETRPPSCCGVVRSDVAGLDDRWIT